MEAHKSASFAFETTNLGDDLQVLAVSSFLPRLDALIARDRCATEEMDEPHLLVMNSWFQKRQGQSRWYRARPQLLPPHPSLDPLFFGFCVGTDELLNRDWLDYLGSHGTIGCRDTESVAKLSKAGIPTEWTGCATASFGRYFTPVPASERSGVLIVDVPPKREREFIPAHLAEGAERISNFAPDAILHDPIQRMHHIARVCDRLRRAELVITRRLHVALPCVGFGTPVVVILELKDSNTRRFSGFDTFLPIILYDATKTSGAVDWERREPPKLPDELARHADRLASRVRSAMGVGSGVGERIYDNVAETVVISTENPGLGPEPGEIAIKIGGVQLPRPVEAWSDRSVSFRIDGFASLDRWNLPVQFRGRRRPEWVTVGTVGDLFRRGRQPVGAAEAARAGAE